MKTPEPGIHHGIAETVYRSWDAVSRSDLEPLHNGRTPAHALEAKLHPTDQTPAMALGSAVHRAILEPERFAREYAARPAGIDKRTVAGKAAWKAFEMEHAGAEILSAEDFERCERMRDAAWKNPLVESLLRGAQTEVSATWDDPATGLRCKSRLDAISSLDGWTFVIDVKTTADASLQGFAKSVANYGYHRQAAFYLDGLSALAERERRFLFVVIEKEPPFCAAVRELDFESLEMGRRQVRAALGEWKRCTDTGHWYGYPLEIETIELPRWAMSYADEETL